MTAGGRARSHLSVAIAMFTAIPVPTDKHRPLTDANAAAALRWLPAVGVLLGGLAGLPTIALLARRPDAGLPAAVVGIGALALLSRGLHLDGLADTADGLGSRAPAERALEIMRRSDIGPFGVVTIVLVVLLDVASLAGSATTAHDWALVPPLVTAAATGRLAAVHAALRGVPAARRSGFGALVAGSVRLSVALGLTFGVLALGVGAAAVERASLVGWPVAQCGGLLVALALRALTTRRFGGVSGDVFGAVIETAVAVTLIGLLLAR
jgi:adenosylcobinamide-GDP ribazoletransferase